MKKPKNKETRYCRDCIHHYDEHDMASDGSMILCRCPFFRFSRLMNYQPDTCHAYARI